MANFVDSLKEYIYGLNEMSSLEIAGKDNDIFHIFARTRVSPYNFYYRSLTIRYVPYGCFWQPWVKMDMDIPSTESGFDVHRLDNPGTYLVPVIDGSRVYLFMPHLVARTLPTTENTKEHSEGNVKTSQEANPSAAKPQHMWELSLAWTELDLPAVTDFRFEPVFERGRASDSGIKLALLVSHTTNDTSVEKTRGKPIGAFVFSEDQMRVLRPDPNDDRLLRYTPTRRPFAVAFQRIMAKGSQATKDRVREEIETLYGVNNKTLEKPILFIPSDLEKANTIAQGTRKLDSITWTMSYSETEAPLALALSSHRDDGTSVGYFTVPRVKMSGTKQWDPKHWERRLGMVMTDHPFAHQLMQQAAHRSEPLKRVFSHLGGIVPQKFPESFGLLHDRSDPENKDTGHHELSHAMAIYNWELGVHSVMLAVERFFATQQFDEALEVARLVFDPTMETKMHRYVTRKVEEEVVIEGKKQTQVKKKTTFEELKTSSCWRFPPFQDIARKIADAGKDSPVDLDSGMPVDIKMALLERQSHGGLVHASARGRPQAYMKWFVMKYAEILIAAGDVHFRRGTMESLPLATQRYVEAAHFLGPEPPKVPRLVSKQKAKVLTFATYKSLAEKEVMNDLGLPFSAELTLPGDPQADTSGLTGADRGTLGVLRTSYFCVPLNPKFKELRNMVHTRLNNLRNSRDIEGRPVSYALIDPPLNPGALVALSKAGVTASEALGLVMVEQEGPLPRQRFEVLLHSALELTSELRSFGERLLSAIERKESETLSVMHAKQATVVARMMLGIRQLQLTEAQQSIDSLQQNRDSHVSQLEFYLRLIGEDPKTKIPSPKDQWQDITQDIDTPARDDLRMSLFERAEMTLSALASTLNAVSSGIDMLIPPICAIPKVTTITAPMGMGASIELGGENFAQGFQAASMAIKTVAMGPAEGAQMASRKAGLSRQLQERRMQASIHGREIKAIDKQIELQQLRVQAA
ncbi:hypothetical protein VTJ49DRAFT_4669 [Mycothermus thermophilus]|uniref:Neuraminidase-like domain-containing protein n=1 Tax=Humicola insolens TaxID=85995 RepID=A0ABR3VMC0_HUMIN